MTVGTLKKDLLKYDDDMEVKIVDNDGIAHCASYIHSPSDDEDCVDGEDKKYCVY